jgi:two-component system chemotaxis response regulator CheB
VPLATSPKTLKVLVVDDSAVVRQTLTAILEQEPGTTVTVAADPLIAQAKIARERPDVIVLDLEMPRMDGLTFLRELMRTDPIPVVICSGLTVAGAEHAMRAVEEGAVSIVTKPKIAVREFLYESAVTLVDAVHAAAQARLPVSAFKRPATFLPVGVLRADAVLPRARAMNVTGRGERVLAIGASAGGTEALRVVLQAFPADAPGTVVVQHMPEVFTRAFAARLDTLCTAEVKEAADGDELRPGRVLIAPGDRHTMLRRSGSGYVVAVTDGPLVSRHRPSVDVLFRSVAQVAGRHAAGALLTGMGDDGAQGLLEMREAGAFTVAQDEASCVVFGMPREAIKRGAARHVLPLDHIAGVLLAGSLS